MTDWWHFRNLSIFRPHGAQQQTSRTPRDRQTDGQTHDRFIDPARYIKRVVSMWCDEWNLRIVVHRPVASGLVYTHSDRAAVRRWYTSDRSPAGRILKKQTESTRILLVRQTHRSELQTCTTSQFSSGRPGFSNGKKHFSLHAKLTGGRYFQPYSLGGGSDAAFVCQWILQYSSVTISAYAYRCVIWICMLLRGFTADELN